MLRSVDCKKATGLFLNIISLLFFSVNRKVNVSSCFFTALFSPTLSKPVALVVSTFVFVGIHFEDHLNS